MIDLMAQSFCFVAEEADRFLYEPYDDEGYEAEYGKSLHNFGEIEAIYTYINVAEGTSPEEAAKQLVRWIFEDMSRPGEGKSFHLTGYDDLQIQLYDAEDDEIPEGSGLDFKNKLSEDQWALFASASVTFEGILTAADETSPRLWLDTPAQLQLIAGARMDRAGSEYILRLPARLPDYYKS